MSYTGCNMALEKLQHNSSLHTLNLSSSTRSASWSMLKEYVVIVFEKEKKGFAANRFGKIESSSRQSSNSGGRIASTDIRQELQIRRRWFAAIDMYAEKRLLAEKAVSTVLRDHSAWREKCARASANKQRAYANRSPR